MCPLPQAPHFPITHGTSVGWGSPGIALGSARLPVLTVIFFFFFFFSCCLQDIFIIKVESPVCWWLLGLSLCHLPVWWGAGSSCCVLEGGSSSAAPVLQQREKEEESSLEVMLRLGGQCWIPKYASPNSLVCLQPGAVRLWRSSALVLLCWHRAAAVGHTVLNRNVWEWDGLVAVPGFTTTHGLREAVTGFVGIPKARVWDM